jgi:DnaJ-class molecular chaperone
MKHPWDRPCGRGERSFNRAGKIAAFSSSEHKSCWDCEHVMVAEQGNRKCNLFEEAFIWSGHAENELQEMGKTVADECPSFQLCSELQGKEVSYCDEEFKECPACDGSGREISNSMLSCKTCKGYGIR